jgi:hypothetical protein
MTFPFQSSAFWGLLVLADHQPGVPTPVHPTAHRPRLVARWVRGADGRLERRWHRATLGEWMD